MKRIIKYLILAVIAVVFVGTLVFLYRKSQEKPVVYQVDSPAKMTIVKKTVATGKVIPRREIEVKSQVSGVVEKLYVAAGQPVKKGAVIARIALRPSMLNVSQAEAQVQSAKTQPAATRRRTSSATSKLLAQKLISRVEFNTYQTNFDLQKEAVAAAENTLLLLQDRRRRNAATVSNMIPATIDGTVLDVPIQGRRLHPRDQHVPVRHHARDAGRHERHDLRRPGRRVRGRQAQAGHGAGAERRRARRASPSRPRWNTSRPRA